MNILIVDDHELIREGLKKVLHKQPDFIVAGEASNSADMFKQLEKNEVDIIILDISMPGRTGLDSLNELKSRFPSVKVLVLSMHPEERFAVRALKAGAAGYMTKESAAQELVQAIRKISGGGKYISSALAEYLAMEIGSENNKPVHEILSNREYEILIMISTGKSISKIAEELSLSINTVTSYRARILEKMNMKTNAEIIRYAVKHQLVD
ncbi:MAG: response regulator transcription factor [Bacteroidetes bacterium]|nr:response regulator transcription factor [Bacteroidota bacterium]